MKQQVIALITYIFSNQCVIPLYSVIMIIILMLSLNVILIGARSEVYFD